MRLMSTDDRPAVTRTHTLLRWLAVLPAAILAGWIAHFAFGLLSLAVASVLSESAANYARLLLYYAPKDAAFVIVGARVAPRPLATAVVLAVAAMAVSLLVHILGQSTVGVTNYLHFMGLNFFLNVVSNSHDGAFSAVSEAPVF